MCLLCSEELGNADQCRKVCTFEQQQTLLEHCNLSLLKGHDTWSTEVSSRINAFNNLIAEEASYHVYCYNRYVKHKQLKASGATGRPEDQLLSNLFDSLCEWLKINADEKLH